MSDLRGKRLHPDIARRVLGQYEHGFFDDAVLNAFKVVEEKLRTITGQFDADAMELIKQAFHPNTGMLTDTRAWPSEREGFHQFFRGVFLSFRNGPAHRFLELDAEEAFDLIVLANRLFILVEEGHQRLTSIGSASPHVPSIKYRSTDNQHGPFLLDVDGDGENEIIIPSLYKAESPIEIYKSIPTGTHSLPIEPVEVGGECVEDIVLVDVDNDGINELVCVVGYAAAIVLILYKYRNGNFEVLKGEHPDTGQPTIVAFEDAQIIDIDGDGKLEVVSEPYNEIAEDVLPVDHSSDSWRNGRVRYVRRWNNTKRYFELLQKELLYIGGR